MSSTKPPNAKAIVINGEAIPLHALPVAPEFVESLKETATKAALDHLKKIGAQPELVQLVESISDLGYYLMICYSHPDTLLGDRRSRLDIENIVIEAINAIAGLDGEFHGPYGSILSREEANKEQPRKSTTKGGKHV